jgi:hypothetical protein
LFSELFVAIRSAWEPGESKQGTSMVIELQMPLLVILATITAKQSIEK